MRKMDSDGLLLCQLQATAFEKSVEKMDCSSEIFLRRFMKSKIAKLIDDESILDTNLQSWDILDLVEEEYGKSNYGSVKYTCDEMYWIGYTYRYYCYTYELKSIQAYQRIKPKELKEVYFAYHSLDPAQAIERVLEAKGAPINEEMEFERQLEIFRKVRNRNKKMSIN